MAEPTSAGGAIALFKLHMLFAAAVGAAVMAMSRPPKDRRTLALQGTVALCSSYLFGNPLASWLDLYVPWVDLVARPGVDSIDFYIAVHGLVGALSWGVFGGVGALRDQLRDDPRGFIEWFKSLIGFGSKP